MTTSSVVRHENDRTDGRVGVAVYKCVTYGRCGRETIVGIDDPAPTCTGLWEFSSATPHRSHPEGAPMTLVWSDRETEAFRVWVVGSGDYEQWGPDYVFDTEEAAEAFAASDADRWDVATDIVCFRKATS